MRKRGFAVVEEYKDKDINLPVRATKHSAGYDIEAAEDVVIPSVTKYGDPEAVLVPTGLKVYCHDDEYVALVSRSSNFKKMKVIIPNSVGIIDADYVDNPDNEGHFFFAFVNLGNEDVIIKKGQRIGQAIFHKFMTVDGDNATGERNGGWGSTNG